MAESSPFPRTVRGVLGPQASGDLVNWLMSGHDELRAAIRADLQQELQGVERRMTDQIRALDEKLSQRIHAVDVRVAESKADLMRWSLVFWVGAVGAIAALAGVLRMP